MTGRVLWLAMWVSVLALLLVQVSPLIGRYLLGIHYEPDIEQLDPAPRGDMTSNGTETEALSNILAPPQEQHAQKSEAQRREEEEQAAKRLAKLWRHPPSKGYRPCIELSPDYKATKRKTSRGYLLVNANGGLNQMRAGICDMVAVARILNATLVIPELDKGSYWKDPSNFSDIFDMAYFIRALRDDVEVVPALPETFRHAERVRLYFRSWSDPQYYSEEIAQNWIQYKVIQALKSDSRLANSGLPPALQKLRCRVHYKALRFAPQIEAFGKELVRRMRANGPYIALHLRYEKDMLAFTGCTHGLTAEEADELTQIRLSTKHWRVKAIDSAAQRAQGLCPLTPHEVGRLLRALGFPNETRVYVAAGEIYGGERRMDHLRRFFPLLLRKESLASKEELAPFCKRLNAMAALDYLVAVESDVFVPTYSGNMARAVEGHRRFAGHRKTIVPDRREIVRLFERLDRGDIQEGPALWEEIQLIHMHRQGAPRPRRGPLPGTHGKDKFRSEEAFYTNPLPDCMCRDAQHAVPGGRATGIRRARTALTTQGGVEGEGGGQEGEGEGEGGSSGGEGTGRDGETRELVREALEGGAGEAGKEEEEAVGKATGEGKEKETASERTDGGLDAGQVAGKEGGGGGSGVGETTGQVSANGEGPEGDAIGQEGVGQGTANGTDRSREGVRGNGTDQNRANGEAEKEAVVAGEGSFQESINEGHSVKEGANGEASSGEVTTGADTERSGAHRDGDDGASRGSERWNGVAVERSPEALVSKENENVEGSHIGEEARQSQGERRRRQLR